MARTAAAWIVFPAGNCGNIGKWSISIATICSTNASPKFVYYLLVYGFEGARQRVGPRKKAGKKVTDKEVND